MTAWSDKIPMCGPRAPYQAPDGIQTEAVDMVKLTPDDKPIPQIKDEFMTDKMGDANG